MHGSFLFNVHRNFLNSDINIDIVFDEYEIFDSEGKTDSFSKKKKLLFPLFSITFT